MKSTREKLEISLYCFATLESYHCATNVLQLIYYPVECAINLLDPFDWPIETFYYIYTMLEKYFGNTGI